MKKYIFYSTIFCLFSESLEFHLGIDLKLFYLVILSNLFLMLITYGGSIKVNKWHIGILSYLTLTGIVSLILGTNKVGLFLEQIVGISIVSIYFYIFWKIFYDWGINKIFITYCSFCYVIAIIGFIKLFVQLFIPVNYWRFESIFKEPAHYITVVFPAIFYYFKKRDKTKFIVMFLSLILTFSAVAYLGLTVALLINSRINFKYIIISIIAAGLFFFIAYKNSKDFAARVNDTVIAVKTSDLSEANLSSYALVSNFLVAIKSFQSNPLFGSGLGSHQFSHDKYISTITGIENFDDFINLNSNDANSLMLRIISDLGLAGVIMVIYFLIKYYSRKTAPQSIITKAVFLYFFCKLLREGHYFSPEMYFFVFLYYFNATKITKKTEAPHYPINAQLAVDL